MPGQLVCRPEQTLPVAVLKVAGVLDLVTGPALRRAVRRCLSTQPEAVLIDVAELDIEGPQALDELTSVVHQNAEWPAVPIVLCAAGPDTVESLAKSPVHGEVGMADSCAEALAQATVEPDRHRVRIRLRPVPDACRQARAVVTRAVAAWHLGDITATASLVATELVANVVRHAHTTMEFTMALRDGRISLAVRDGSVVLPRPAEPGVTDAGGRGLRLVRELSDAWGVLPMSDGKVVWTTLNASAPG
jgi:anti-sigma regulatory factor (Ser/Thr protein kinase)